MPPKQTKLLKSRRESFLECQDAIGYHLAPLESDSEPHVETQQLLGLPLDGTKRRYNSVHLSRRKCLIDRNVVSSDTGTKQCDYNAGFEQKGSEPSDTPEQPLRQVVEVYCERYSQPLWAKSSGET